MTYAICGVLYVVAVISMMVRLVRITEEMVYYKGDTIWYDVYEVFILLAVVTAGTVIIPIYAVLEAYYNIVCKRAHVV